MFYFNFYFFFSSLALIFLRKFFFSVVCFWVYLFFCSLKSNFLFGKSTFFFSFFWNFLYLIFKKLKKKLTLFSKINYFFNLNKLYFLSSIYTVHLHVFFRDAVLYKSPLFGNWFALRVFRKSMRSQLAKTVFTLTISTTYTNLFMNLLDQNKKVLINRSVGSLKIKERRLRRSFYAGNLLSSVLSLESVIFSLTLLPKIVKKQINNYHNFFKKNYDNYFCNFPALGRFGGFRVLRSFRPRYGKYKAVKKIINNIPYEGKLGWYRFTKYLILKVAKPAPGFTKHLIVSRAMFIKELWRFRYLRRNPRSFRLNKWKARAGMFLYLCCYKITNSAWIFHHRVLYHFLKRSYKRFNLSVTGIGENILSQGAVYALRDNNLFLASYVFFARFAHAGCKKKKSRRRKIKIYGS